LNSDLIQEVAMASSDMNRDSADNGPDTTPGIPPTGPAPLMPHPVADTAFHPPPRDGMSGLTIGLAAAVVVLGLYVLINWPWSRQPVAVTVAPEAAAVAPSAAPSGAAPAGPDVPAVTPEPAPAAAASGVHRCEKAGQVSYTDGPCPAGMRGSAVNVSEALSVEGARGATLYRCKGAGQFWSIVHCQHKGAEIVSMHTVPADLPLAEQIVFARNRLALSRPAFTAAARAVEVGPPAPLNAASNKARHCKDLDERIAALDDYARQPLQAYEQDAIRRDRKKARDEQFGLRCGR
jgi:hypothetical protein